MQSLYKLTIDEYIEIVEIAKELGIKEGESMESVFLSYVEIKGKKPFTNTELTKTELLKEISQKQNILNIEVDKQGHTKYSIIKKKKTIHLTISNQICYS